MVLQGFNASEKTSTEIVEFCERLEFTEGLSNDAKNGKTFQTDPKGGRQHRKGDGKSSVEASKNDE